ncbi:hypothetical protein ACLBWV_16410 [Microbacterium paraoxydans]
MTAVAKLTEEQKAARVAKRQMTNALREEAGAHRNEAKRQEWRDKGMYLTREQAAAGELCRGCGLPVIDNLGNWPGTMYLTPEEKAEYDADQARYKEMHPDCEAHRWSMSGSRATHCGFCCLPVPMSPEQYENISKILLSSPRREEELDIWERTLTCGHVVEQRVHHTNQRPSFSTARCPECELTRGVVSSAKTVEAAARMAEAKRKLDEQVTRAERELKKAEKVAAEAREKLAKLKSSPERTAT